MRDNPNQDYADQRYYNVGTGRFNVPDPYQASGGAADPTSWNRYTYVGGDPVNRADPQGLWWQYVGTGACIVGYNDGAPDYSTCDLYQWIDSPPIEVGDPSDGVDMATSKYHVPGTKLTITDPAKSSNVYTTISSLKAALGNDKGCASWLSTGSGSDDVRMSGGISGYLDNLQNVAGAASIDDDTVAALANTSPYVPGFNLLFNTQGGFFLGSGSIGMQTSSADLASTTFNSDRGREFFLLHELAHLVGAPGFVGNDEAASLQRANNDDLWQHCNKTIMSFSNVSGRR